jgi:hypothetical protein
MAVYSNRIVISISKIWAGPKLNITNSQSTPAQTGLQVMWQVSVSTLQTHIPWLNSNLSNMRFVYNGQFIPAWIESINNGTATIWIKLPVGIPANSSIVLNLYSNSTLNFDGVYWGEAPQLSSAYGQYDNGANVFNNYWNFAGTTMPSGWNTTEAANLTVNNGISFSGVGSGGNAAQIVYTTAIPRPLVIEYYGYSFGTQATDAVAYVDRYGSPFLNGYMANVGVNSGVAVITFSNGGNTIRAIYTPSSYPPTTSYHIWTLSVAPIGGTISALIDYGTTLVPVSWTDTLNYNNYYPALSCWWNNKGIYVQYARIRAYPPNGVMPTVELMLK